MWKTLLSVQAYIRTKLVENLVKCSYDTMDTKLVEDLAKCPGIYLRQIRECPAAVHQTFFDAGAEGKVIFAVLTGSSVIKSYMLTK